MQEEPASLAELFKTRHGNEIQRSSKYLHGCPTHTLMNGGVVKVSDDEMFHRLYTKAVLAGEFLYYCELRSWEWFKMFLDIDMKVPYEPGDGNIKLGDDFLNIMLKCIHVAVKKFFPSIDENDNIFNYVVCDAPGSMCSDSSLYKFGLHINMKYITVSTHEALLMREMIVHELTLNGPSLYKIDWADAVDNAPLCNQTAGSGGLRMVGSRKMSKCKSCRRGGICAVNGCVRGLIDEGRAYVFRACYMSGEYNKDASELLRNNLFSVVTATSIRERHAHNNPNGPKQNLLTLGWVRPIGCPSYGDLKKAKGIETTTSKQRVFDDDKATMRHWKAKVVVTDSKIINILETNIRKRFLHGHWSQIRVSNVVTNPEMSSYMICVTGAGSNFCMNKIPPCDHSSSSIWFIMDKDGLSQRCFCKKLTFADRRGKLCKDFRSMPPKKLEAWEIAILFPTAQAQHKLEPGSTKREHTIFGTELLDSLKKAKK